MGGHPTSRRLFSLLLPFGDPTTMPSELRARTMLRFDGAEFGDESEIQEAADALEQALRS